MSSPVKLQYNEDTHNKHHETVRPNTTRKLVEALFPDVNIQPPNDPSPLKPPLIQKWRKGTQTIVAHLAEVKRVAEIQVRRGYMKTAQEYYDSLLDSVCIDELVDWHELHGRTYNNDPVMLTVLLLEHFHSPFDATASYNKLVGMPCGHTVATLEQFLVDAEKLAPRIGSLLSSAGLCVEILRHVSDEIVTRLDLHNKVDHGMTVTHLIASLRNEVTKISTTTQLAPAMRFNLPAPHVPPAPDAMNVDAVAIVNAVLNGMQHNNNWKRGGNWGGGQNSNNNDRKERVPHSSGQVCRNFQNFGNCKFGERCIHLHTQSK
jgi:hypothetical protein